MFSMTTELRLTYKLLKASARSITTSYITDYRLAATNQPSVQG